MKRIDWTARRSGFRMLVGNVRDEAFEQVYGYGTRVELMAEILSIIGTLGTRDRMVIAASFGLFEDRPETLKGIARRIGVSGGRVRQIKARALQKLRQPSKSKRLEPFWGEEDGARIHVRRRVQIEFDKAQERRRETEAEARKAWNRPKAVEPGTIVPVAIPVIPLSVLLLAIDSNTCAICGLPATTTALIERVLGRAASEVPLCNGDTEHHMQAQRVKEQDRIGLMFVSYGGRFDLAARKVKTTPDSESD